MPSDGGGGGGVRGGLHGLIVTTSNEGNRPLACKICACTETMRTTPNATGPAAANKPTAWITIFLRIPNFSDSYAMDRTRPSSVL
jgi:hypothetical protein